MSRRPAISASAGAASLERVGAIAAAGLIVVAILGVASGAGASTSAAIDRVVCRIAAAPASDRPDPCPSVSAGPAEGAADGSRRRGGPSASRTARLISNSGLTPALPQDCTVPVDFGSKSPGRLGQICVHRGREAMFCWIDGGVPRDCGEGIPRSFVTCAPALDLASPTAERCVVRGIFEDGGPEDLQLSCDGFVGVTTVLQDGELMLCRSEDGLPRTLDLAYADCDPRQERQVDGKTFHELACFDRRTGAAYFCSTRGKLARADICDSRTFPDAGALACRSTVEAGIAACVSGPAGRPMLCTILPAGGPHTRGKPLHCVSTRALRGAAHRLIEIAPPTDCPPRGRGLQAGDGACAAGVDPAAGADAAALARDQAAAARDQAAFWDRLRPRVGAVVDARALEPPELRVGSGLAPRYLPGRDGGAGRIVTPALVGLDGEDYLEGMALRHEAIAFGLGNAAANQLVPGLAERSSGNAVAEYFLESAGAQLAQLADPATFPEAAELQSQSRIGLWLRRSLDVLGGPRAPAAISFTVAVGRRWLRRGDLTLGGMRVAMQEELLQRVTVAAVDRVVSYMRHTRPTPLELSRLPR